MRYRQAPGVATDFEYVRQLIVDSVDKVKLPLRYTVCWVDWLPGLLFVARLDLCTEPLFLFTQLRCESSCHDNC